MIKLASFLDCEALLAETDRLKDSAALLRRRGGPESCLAIFSFCTKFYEESRRSVSYKICDHAPANTLDLPGQLAMRIRTTDDAGLPNAAR